MFEMPQAAHADDLKLRHCVLMQQEEREQVRAKAEAQNWEGVEPPPPEPTEAQRRAEERAEEVRRLRKVGPCRYMRTGTCDWRRMSTSMSMRTINGTCSKHERCPDFSAVYTCSPIYIHDLPCWRLVSTLLLSENRPAHRVWSAQRVWSSRPGLVCRSTSWSSSFECIRWLLMQAADAVDATAGKKGKAPGRRGGRPPQAKVAAA